MSSTVSLRTDLLEADGNGNGPSSGGVWTYLGYSPNIGGSYSGAGNLPYGWSLSGDNPTIDTSGADQGVYKFNYAGGSGEECEADMDVILQVIEGCIVEPGDDADICENQAAVVNLWNNVQGSCEIVVNEPTLPATGWSFNSSTGVLTIDSPNSALAGETYTFVVSVSRDSGASSGYTVHNCPNCDPDNFEVTIKIVESFYPGEPVQIAACNDGTV